MTDKQRNFVDRLPKLEEALKVDYKNILKVWNQNGKIIWSK